MAIESVTIKGHAFAVGDMCVLKEFRRSLGTLQAPADISVQRIAKLCGGETRQWVKLANGQEFSTDGYERGSTWSNRGPLLIPYEEAEVKQNAAEQKQYRERCELSIKTDRVRWDNVILQDDLAAKLREIVEAAEARGLMRP